MMTFEEFETALGEAAKEIPDEYFVDLNGGVTAHEECKIHPQSRGDELCIMGEYQKRYGLGNLVVLYYGSFARQYVYQPDEFWKKEIRRVLEHELTHHLESLAGEKDLEIDDKIQLARYLNQGE